MATKSEIAWAAGLFEGEGCFHAMKNYHYVYPRMIVSSTDLDVLEKFQRIVGAGTINKGRRVASHHKTQYQLSISKQTEIERISNLFWPWLGERRRQQLLTMEERVESNKRIRAKEHS